VVVLCMTHERFKCYAKNSTPWAHWEYTIHMAGKKLQGQVAIISGAGRGLGAAAATLLARAGASVVLTARSSDEIEALAAAITAEGLTALAVAADVTDLEQLEAVVQSGLDAFGRVDILVNNAAVVWPLEPIVDVDPDEWAYTIHTNLIGPFYLTRYVLPLMLDAGYGRILNVSSSAAQKPIAGASAYCASKAGLDMLTRTLALEVAGTPVTVNSFDPGMVDTGMQEDIRSVDGDEMGMGMDLSMWHRAHEQGKLRAPAEVARGIYWLAGPWSRGESGHFFSYTDATWRATVHDALG
jgi:NAD(P)-dependent dehydrogenase (short-subunit alcohol dehydrogenase family)